MSCVRVNGFLLRSGLAVLGWASPSFADTWHYCPVNGHLYRLTTGVMSWEDANVEALTFNAELATIRSEAEEDWIIATFESLADPVEKSVWIGLRQPPESGEPSDGWAWVSQEPFSYANWCSTEPNEADAGEDFAELTFTTNPNYYKCWNDDQVPNIHGLIERHSTVPAVSEWGLVVLCLSLMVFGVIAVRGRTRITP